MKIKKGTLALVFLLASLFLLVGVIGTVSAQSGKTAAPGQRVLDNFPTPRVVDVNQRKFVVYYIVDGLTNESSIRHYTQIQNEAKYRGWTLLKETNATYEAGKTRKAFQTALDQNPDAIVFSYLDIPPFMDLIKVARDKGIGVYCIGTDWVPGILMNTYSNNSVIAAKIVDYAIQRKGGVGGAVGFIDLWMPRGIRRDIIVAAMFEKGGYDFGETAHHKLTPEGFTDEIYSVTTNWITKYGDKLGFVWVCWDLGGITAARAMAAKGYTDKQMFTVGIDGGSMPWSVIRRGEIPFVASLAEPFEYQVHQTMEAIKQVQIDNMKPDAPGFIIPASHNLSTDGYTMIIDSSNVPPVGTNIHAVFNYYGGNPKDKSAWYNWGQPYIVKDVKE